jgi:hypothetical protein
MPQSAETDPARVKRLAEKLATMAFAMEAGGGEAATLFLAAETLDALDDALRKERETARCGSTRAMHDIAVLLGGGQVISPDDCAPTTRLRWRAARRGMRALAVSRVKHKG